MFASTQTTHTHTRIPHAPKRDTSTTPPLALRSESRFARHRLTPEAGDDIEQCRANLTKRVTNCHLTCDACSAECTSIAALLLVSAYKCSLGLPTLGMAAAFHSSDVGVDIAHRWGAKRTDGRPASPDAAYQEQYRVMVQNSLDTPIAPRNCKSCTNTFHTIW